MHSSATSRRRFLTEVGKGTLLATIGPALGAELDLAPTAVNETPGSLHFGAAEPLVAMLQETPIAKLQETLVKKLAAGVTLKELVAAGVLANARSFGGEDYVGFHTLMALGPAWKMTAAMPEKQRALPVFKVLYRNTNRIQEHGGRAAEVLHPVAAGPAGATAEQLHAAVQRKDHAEAERTLATLVKQNLDDGFAALLTCVQDAPEVHRTVLPYRAWDLLDIVGSEHATTMLRQSLRYCLQAESYRRPEWEENAQALSRLLDEHHLLGKPLGQRALDDSGLSALSIIIFEASPEAAAGAVAAALAEGFDPRHVGEAISLAANQLVLRDHGRPPEWESPGKPPGSVHGDSVGVHASDSVHAWRNLAQVSHGHHAVACLILGAWQVARDRRASGQAFMDWQPLPTASLLASVAKTDPSKLLTELDTAISNNLQGHAIALVQQMATLGQAPEPVFARLLPFAVSEDGALHAEKYFATCEDEFSRTRPAFRWRHLMSLARVTASEYGRPAPGQAEARVLLGV